jgi:signal recognition particle subunit SRP54
MDALALFHPDRMASRILGMGDVLSLIEKAEAAVDQKQAQEMERKLRNSTFDFEDYLEQMRQMRKMGPLDQLLGMIPGMGAAKAQGLQIDEKQLAHVEAMICSMTKAERHEPAMINGSRRRRIAAGSGRSIQEVNKLLTQFDQMRKMMRGFAAMEGSGVPGMPAIGARGKHAGSNKGNKKKPPPAFKLPFGRR